MSAEHAKRLWAAMDTLEHLGYTYEGGEQWKPPLGKKPEWVDSPEKRYVFVSGPGAHTICQYKYSELMIRVMCLETGDDQSEYTITTIPNPSVV